MTDIQTQGSDNYSSFNTTNHWHNGNDSPAFAFTNLTNRTRYIEYRIVAPTTAVAVAAKVGGDFSMPFGGNFVINGVNMSSVGATVDTAGVTGNMTIDVLLNGTSIFNQVVTTTKITIATASKTSRGNTSQPLIQTMSFLTGDVVTITVSTVQTTPALGLTVFLKVVETTV